MNLEEKWIKKALAGDEQGFRNIVETYKNLVFSICNNIIKNPEEAKNISQETFLKVYQSLSEYKGKGLKTWICRIATNKAIDYKRKVKVYEQKVRYIEDGDVFISQSPLPQEVIVHEEEITELREHIQRLPDKYRNVFYQYYEKNKTYKQIADEEKISVKTVETRLYRGKRLLKDCFEEVEGT